MDVATDGAAGGIWQGGEASALDAVLQIDARSQQRTCKHCNLKKSNSKQAQEQSDKIYMCVMVRERPLEEQALVLEASEDWAQLYIYKHGIDIRVYFNDDLRIQVRWMSW
jgi:exoribonuclease R